MSEFRVPGIAKPCGVCGRFPDDPKECASVDLTPPATTAAPFPVRQKSANGKPKRDSEFFRRCHRCGADFIGLAFGKTGEVGLWDGARGMRWWCSVECYNHDHQESPYVA